MPIEITSQGFQTMTFEEIFAELQQKNFNIFGDDLIYDESSYDYQKDSIDAYKKVEEQDLAQNIYASYDYQQAQGVSLNRCAKQSGLFRKAGSFTLVNIKITTDRAVNLAGLDSNIDNINGTGFQVSDGNGNQFILVDSQNIATAGQYTFSFRAKNLGAIAVAINSVINLDTIILGVVSCNNETAQSILGSDEETDASLRERIRLSFANQSSSDIDSLRSKILNISGVQEAVIYENVTNTTDSNSIPPKSIWCIIEGGSNTNIIDIIYQNRANCDTKGSIEVIKTTKSGQYLPIRFDRPTSLNLYLKFDLKKTNLLQTFNLTAIKQSIVNNTFFEINKYAETSNLTGIIKNAIDSNGGGGVVINVLISKDNTNWSEYLDVNLISDRFILSASNIAITEI